ncbi:MAG TPA: hypothetical protein VE291_01995 [Terracidiphilus sp.]|jgi:hypothetical protein|nr:hypothetical protein [Terracidiphilus sp.]
MKTGFLKVLSCVGVAALVFAAVPGAAAQCGLPNKPIKPTSWHPKLGQVHPSLVRTAYENINFEPSIVGMWHAIFTAQTQNGEEIPVPGGVVIDNSVVVWHSDGTEIMNSSRSAQDGNFCLGVWEQTGPRTFFLNHIPWQGNVFDPTVPPDTIGAPQGGAQILERIRLSPDGNSYEGTFTLTAYDTSGKVYVSFTGTLSAKRITPNTPFSALL